MPIGLTAFASSLWSSAPSGTASPSSRTSQPPGLEALLEYNGLIMHDRKVTDKYRVNSLDGVHGGPDIRDNREANPSDIGETPFDSQLGGRTIMIEGTVEAGNIGKLRDLQQALRSAFYSMQERPLIFRTGNSERDVFIYAKMIDKISMKEEQTNTEADRRFQITLRASDPRFRSINDRIATQALGTNDTFTVPTTVLATNIIKNPVPQGNNLNGYSANGGALSNPSPGVIRHTSAGTAGTGTYYSGTGGLGQISGLTAGFVYTGSLNLNAFPAGRTFALIIEWRNAANAVISSTSLAINSPVAGQRYAVTGTAPAGTTQALLDFYYTGSTPANGETMDTSKWMFALSNNSTYFAGNFYRARWTGAANASTSEYLAEDNMEKSIFRQVDETEPVSPSYPNKRAWLDGTYLALGSNNGVGITLGGGSAQLNIPYQPIDSKITFGFKTLPLSYGADALVLFQKSVAVNDALALRYEQNTTTAATLKLVKIIGGAETSLAATASFTVASNTKYWIQSSVVGNLVTARVFSTDPTGGGGTGLSAVLSYTLAGADATKLGAGVAGDIVLGTSYGINGNDVSMVWLVDDFRFETISLNTNFAKIINAGNYIALPKFKIYGPLSNITLSNQTAMPDEAFLRSIKINGAIPAGRYYEYDAQKGTLVDDLGVNKFSQYDVNSKQIQFRDGENVMRISADGGSDITPKVVVTHQDTWI